jgi:hypothetical protein
MGWAGHVAQTEEVKIGCGFIQVFQGEKPCLGVDWKMTLKWM